MKIARIRNVKAPVRAHKEDGGIDFFLPEIDEQLVNDFMDLNVDEEATSQSIHMGNDGKLYAKSNALNIIDQNFSLIPEHIYYIPSGIKVSVPFGYTLMTANKSGRIKHDKIVVYPCVIDCGYQGEVIFHLHNISNQIVKILAGEKFVQCVLHTINTDDVIEVPEDDLYENQSKRGEGRMGSTGLQ